MWYLSNAPMFQRCFSWAINTFYILLNKGSSVQEKSDKFSNRHTLLQVSHRSVFMALHEVEQHVTSHLKMVFDSDSHTLLDCSLIHFKHFNWLQSFKKNMQLTWGIIKTFYATLCSRGICISGNKTLKDSFLCNVCHCVIAVCKLLLGG